MNCLLVVAGAVMRRTGVIVPRLIIYCLLGCCVALGRIITCVGKRGIQEMAFLLRLHRIAVCLAHTACNKMWQIRRVVPLLLFGCEACADDEAPHPISLTLCVELRPRARIVSPRGL